MSETSFEVTLPPAVRRAAAAAERLAAEATATAQLEAGITPATPPVEIEGQPATTVASEPAAPATPAPEAKPAEPARDAAYWEQRYRSLQGKYDTEVPNLNGQLRAAQSRITELDGHVADLNMRLRQAHTQAQTQAAPAAPKIAPEDVEAYGQDFIDKVRAWVGAGGDGSSKEEIAAVKQELERLRAQTATNQVERVKADVRTALAAQVPQWEALNTDPAFLAWLAEADPFSGQIRSTMLNQAYTSGDASRTIRFFKAYLAEQTATQPAGDAPAHTPTGAGTVPLAELAAPGRGSPASHGAPAEKRVWTHPQIEAFYRDVQRGKYRQNDAERARIEADIFAAPTEGRLR